MLGTPATFNSRLERLGKPIWERYYMVGIRYRDTLSVDEIKMYGMPTCGNALMDQQVYNDTVDKFLTINQMVEYHKAGTAFWVRNHAETKEIYEVISSYLICWKEYLENGINIGGAPIDDLIALDRLASSVYNHAVEHFTTQYIDSSLMRFMSGQKLGRAAFEKEPEPIVINGEKETKKHDSLSQLFSERVFSVRGK